MAESARVRVVRAYLDKYDHHDFDGCDEHLTDNFNFRTEPWIDVDGFVYNHDSGFDKAKLREYNVEMAKVAGWNPYETIMDNLTENVEQVVAKGTLKFKYPLPGKEGTTEAFGTAEQPFTSEFTFDGDKIKTYMLIIDQGFAERCRKFISGQASFV